MKRIQSWGKFAALLLTTASGHQLGFKTFRAGIIFFLILAHPVYKNVNNTGTK